MTIYILGSPQETAEALDDKSLDNMIKDIAQSLCDLHSLIDMENYYTGISINIPLKPKNMDSKWVQWARECRANYEYLVELGKKCIKEIELHRRLGNYAKLFNVIYWGAYNTPNLPIHSVDSMLATDSHGAISPFPLVMPEKYQSLVFYNPDNWLWSKHIDNISYAYRKYYQSKIDQHLNKYKTYDRLSWTNRNKPAWIEL